MPGYVMHLAVAEQIIKLCHIVEIEDCNELRIGSIVPDTRKGNEKRKSHFWTDEEYIRFARKPDLHMFLNKYGDRLAKPYVFGYYAHLYLDYKFVKEYWPLHYMFYDKNMQPADIYDAVEWVRYIDTDELVLRRDFFSERYYYGDYDRMNRYMLLHYGIETPRYESDMIRAGGVEEVEGRETDQALKEMISFLVRETSEKEAEQPQSAQAIQQSLKAFSLSGMQQLIEQTATELGEIYKTM